MSRPIFWPTNDSYSMSVGGYPQASVPVKIYTRQVGGTQVTDLVFVAPDGTIGAAVPSGVLVTDGNGLIPAFAGPDGGATTLWGNHGMSGERIALTSGPVAGGSVTFGTTSGTAAEGNDSRIVGAMSTATANATFAPLSSLKEAITYNGDGTVSTVTETDSGAVTTYTYNSDGTPATESRLLAGVTTLRTFSYSGGNLVGVS